MSITRNSTTINAIFFCCVLRKVTTVHICATNEAVIMVSTLQSSRRIHVCFLVICSMWHNSVLLSEVTKGLSTKTKTFEHWARVLVRPWPRDQLQQLSIWFAAIQKVMQLPVTYYLHRKSTSKTGPHCGDRQKCKSSHNSH